MPDEPIRELLRPWTAVPSWMLWAQLLALIAGLLIAGAAAAGFRFVGRRGGTRAVAGATWLVAMPVLAGSLAVASVFFAARGMAYEGLRLAALATGAAFAATLALRVIGRTALGWSLAAIAILLAATESLHLAGPAIEILDAHGVALGDLRVTPWFVIRAIVVIAALFWLAQRLGDLIDRTMVAERALSRSGQALFAKLARAGLLIAAFLLSLAFLGVDVTALALLSGAVGLGVGFGLQKIVSNYVAGLILLMDKSIKPGDVIELDFGEGRMRGQVTELAGRYTAITLRTGTETLIPNEILISNPVSNWSHTSRNVQIRIPVGVAYSTDVEKAMKLCVEAAQATSRVIASPSAVCFIAGFGDSSVDLEVRFWISDAESGVRNVSSAVYLNIWKQFQKHGIEIPFPQRDLHIRSAVPFQVGASNNET
jgi:small-conductance mechanosensitive channel